MAGAATGGAAGAADSRFTATCCRFHVAVPGLKLITLPCTAGGTPTPSGTAGVRGSAENEGSAGWPDLIGASGGGLAFAGTPAALLVDLEASAAIRSSNDRPRARVWPDVSDEMPKAVAAYECLPGDAKHSCEGSWLPGSAGREEEAEELASSDLVESWVLFGVEGTASLVQPTLSPPSVAWSWSVRSVTPE